MMMMGEGKGLGRRGFFILGLVCLVAFFWCRGLVSCWQFGPEAAHNKMGKRFLLPPPGS